MGMMTDTAFPLRVTISGSDHVAFIGRHYHRSHPGVKLADFCSGYREVTKIVEVILNLVEIERVAPAVVRTTETNK